MPSFNPVASPSLVAANLVPGGSFETGLESWAGGVEGTGASFTSLVRESHANAASGSFAARLVGSVISGGLVRAVGPTVAGITVGLNYVLAAEVRFNTLPAGGRAFVQIDWLTSGDVLISSSTSAALTANGRAVISAVAPATAAKAKLLVKLGTTNGTAQTIDAHFDAVILSQSAAAITYFNGDTAFCDWDGAAHASASSKYNNRFSATSELLGQEIELDGQGPYAVSEIDAKTLRQAWVKAGLMVEI